jgi:hypothetical protein
MNALEAGERLEKLRSRANSLARVVYYLRGETEWADDVDVLEELQRHAESEYSNLADKLRSVQI